MPHNKRIFRLFGNPFDFSFFHYFTFPKFKEEKFYFTMLTIVRTYTAYNIQPSFLQPSLWMLPFLELLLPLTHATLPAVTSWKFFANKRKVWSIRNQLNLGMISPTRPFILQNELRSSLDKQYNLNLNKATPFYWCSVSKIDQNLIITNNMNVWMFPS